MAGYQSIILFLGNLRGQTRLNLKTMMV